MGGDGMSWKDLLEGLLTVVTFGRVKPPHKPRSSPSASQSPSSSGSASISSSESSSPSPTPTTSMSSSVSPSQSPSVSSSPSSSPSPSLSLSYAAPDPGPTSPTTLLKVSDFKLVSKFRISASLIGYAPTTHGGANVGLAYRYRNGVRYFLLLLQTQDVLEFRDPGGGAWIDPTQAIRYVRPFGDVPVGTINGIYYDSRDSRLYGTYGDPYGYMGTVPSLVAATLDPVGTSKLVGSWTVGSRGYKCVQGGVSRHPDGRLIAGWGGTFSVMSVGGVSTGIALQAFDPPLVPNVQLPTEVLLAYAGQACSPRMPRPMTDPPYDEYLDGCGNAVTGWGDVFASGTLVQTPTKRGFLVAAELVKGYHNYFSSTQVGEGAEHRWVVLDPANFGAGPQEQTVVQFPDEDYTKFPYAVIQQPYISAVRSGGVWTLDAPNHGLDAGRSQSIHLRGSLQGDYRVYVKDANTLQVCASNNNGADVDGVSKCQSMDGGETRPGGTFTKLWSDYTGYNQQLAVVYDEFTQDLFVLMSLPFQYANTFTIYKYHVD